MQEYLNEPSIQQLGMLVELIEKGCTDESMKWPFVQELDKHKHYPRFEHGAKQVLTTFITYPLDQKPVFDGKSITSDGYRLAVRIMETNPYELPELDGEFTWQHMIDHMRQYATPDCPEED